MRTLLYSKVISHFYPSSPFLFTAMQVYNSKRRGDWVIPGKKFRHYLICITPNSHQLDLQGLYKQLCQIFKLHKVLSVYHWKNNGKKSQVSPYPQSEGTEIWWGWWKGKKEERDISIEIFFFWGKHKSVWLQSLNCSQNNNKSIATNYIYSVWPCVTCSGTPSWIR